MNFLSYCALLVSATSIYLGIYILRIKPFSRRNCAFAFVGLGYALWALGYILIYGAADTQSLWGWYRLSAVGFIIVPTAWLFFALEFHHPEKNYSWKWYRLALILIPPVILLIRNFTGYIYAKGFTSTSWGNSTVLDSGSPWPYLYFMYTIVYFGLSIAILVKKYKATTSHRFKKQIRIIITGHLSNLILVYTFNLLFPLLKINLPALGAILNIIAVLFTFYAIVRYKFIAFEPRSIIEKVADYLSESIILLDTRYQIIDSNRRNEIILNMPKERLLKKNIDDFVKEKETLRDFLQQTSMEKQRFDKLEFTMLTQDNSEIYVEMSIIPFVDDMEDFIGYILIIQELDYLQSNSKKYNISEREKEVLLFMLQGLSIQDIAKKLFITNGTVRNHLHSIYQKTGAQNRMELFQLLFPQTGEPHK